MYQHLKAHERDLIAVWKSKGLSNKQIAKRLNRSVSSIGRETKRNRRPDGYYVSIRAQTLTRKRQRAGKRRHPLKTPAVYSYVLEKLRTGWSPEQISGRLKKEQGHPVICHETIYRFIYDSDNQDKRLWEYLPRNQKSRRKQNGRSVHKVRIPQRVSIHDRPEEVNNRSQFGHWEGDNVVYDRHRSALSTSVERKTRKVIITRPRNLTAEEKSRILIKRLRPLPEQARRTMTYDNGKEAARHEAVTGAIGMKFYFAKTYSSWQRGTNENRNGLVRYYLPRDTELSQLTARQIQRVENLINDRPVKLLGYKTPNEAFAIEMNKLKSKL